MHEGYDIRVFDAYKPLRNVCRCLGIKESIEVIWAYSLYLEYEQPLPDYIKVSQEFLRKPKHLKGIQMWELELLAKEIIINGNIGRGGKSLHDWHTLATVINKVKDFENYINGLYVNSNNIHDELRRIAFRQFPSQIEANMHILNRYRIVFGAESISDIMMRLFGMTSAEYFEAAYIIVFSFINQPFLVIDDLHKLNKKAADNVISLLSLFSLPCLEHKKHSREHQRFSDQFAYALSGLKIKPIICIDSGDKQVFASPIPTFIVRRATEGLFYDLVGATNFGNAYGKSIEYYIMELVKRSAPPETDIRYMGETSYLIGKARKDSADCIVYDNNSAIFIECKGKRLRDMSKVAIDNKASFIDDVLRISEFIIQCYKFLHDYIADNVTQFRYDESRLIFPMVVTFEDCIGFGGRVFDQIDEAVREGLNNYCLPIYYADKYPYVVCSINDFEQFAQIIHKVGIKSLMLEKTSNAEFRYWTLSSYLRNSQPEMLQNCKFLYETEETSWAQELKGVFQDLS